MKRKKSIKILTCPCCQNEKNLADLSRVHNTAKQWADSVNNLYNVSRPDFDYVKLFALRDYWACDACLGSGKAIQTRFIYSLRHTYQPLSYIDTEHTCEVCNTHFTFHKREQQHFMEVLKFDYFLPPKKCHQCRKNTRTQKENNNRLMVLLEKTEWQANELEELIAIYTEIGNVEKANRYSNLYDKAQAGKF